MSNDLGDALRAAYEKHEGTDPTGNVGVEPGEETPSLGAGEEEPGKPQIPPEGEAETPPESEAEAPPEGEQEGAKDESAEAESAAKPAAETPETEIAPQAWRGAAKQHWAELPAEVRQEVLRREQETNKVLNDSAHARQFSDRFFDMAANYANDFRAENVDPLTAAHSLFQTAAELRHGTAEQKAGIIYRLITLHGVDESLVDKMLVGEVQSPAGAGQGGTEIDPSVQQMVQKAMAPYTQALQTFTQGQQAQATARQAELNSELDAFAADPKNVFFADVMPVMAELFEAAGRSGRSLSLEQAYKTAIAMDPGLAALEAKRSASAQANNSQSAAARRERAAAVLKPTAAPDSTPAKPVAREDQLSAAWDMHTKGRH